MTKRFTLAVVLGAALTVGSAATAQARPPTISSTFKNGIDQWGYVSNFFGISVLDTPDYVSAGGHPGGYITQPDGDSGNSEHIGAFLNIQKYGGDRSRYYGGLVQFDLRLNANSTRAAEATLTSSKLHTTYYALDTPDPGTEWRRYSIPLVESSWASGAAKANPSKRNFEKVLAKLSGVGVIADYLSTPGETDSMDNYKLIAPKIVKRTLTLRYKAGPGKFVGKVKSAAALCRANAKVRIHKIGRGPDPLVGTPTTNARGRFSLHHKAKHGTFYATVDQKVKPPRICRAAASKNVNLG